MNIAMLAVGDELLNGTIADGNAAHAGAELAARGQRLCESRCVADDIGQIAAALDALARCADIVIVSGGIGPTSDDLTRAAIAHALGEPMVTDEPTIARLRERYAQRGRSMPESNLRQAQFPRSAEILATDVGTADACAVTMHGAWIVSLPGVPHEFRALLARWVMPRCDVPGATRWRGRTHGIGESGLADVVERLRLPDTVTVAYRATAPWVDLSLVGTSDDVADASTVVAEAIARWMLPGAHDSWVAAMADQLGHAGETLATAESCTGGALGSAFTDLPGASTWYMGGYVTYANDAKIAALAVSASTLAAHGAVSAEVATQMAEGARDALGATWSLSTTGVAGPGGGTADKPVGTIWMACAGPDEVTTLRAQLAGRSRAGFKVAACAMASRLLWASAQGDTNGLSALDDVASINVLRRRRA